MKISTKLILVILCSFFALASCAHNPNADKSSKYYRLESISDPVPVNGTKEFASILLRDAGSNRVGVINLDKKYSIFHVYKQEQGEFKLKGTLRAGKPTTAAQRLDEINEKIIYFEDSSTSSIDDRYRIVPVVDGIELSPLRIYYDTEDRNIFRQIEGKEPTDTKIHMRSHN